MGYYIDTGSLQSMASAEAILKKRMPEKVGILPVAELLFVAESMWVGEHDMKGHFHPSFRFVKAKRYNAKPHVLIELDGETLADINGRSKYYEGFSRCVDRKPEEGAWIEPTAKKVRCAETGNQFVSLSDAARAVGLRNGNSIRRAIDRGGTAGGYHWEYLDEKKEVSTDDHHQADGRAE